MRVITVAMATPMTTEELTEPWVPEDSFGNRLAQVRNHMGWNVLEAARECGINQQSWRNWEEGGSPRDFTQACRKIAERTGCSLQWLVFGNHHWKEINGPDLQVVPQVSGSSRSSATVAQAPLPLFLELVPDLPPEPLPRPEPAVETVATVVPLFPQLV